MEKAKHVHSPVLLKVRLQTGNVWARVSSQACFVWPAECQPAQRFCSPQCFKLEIVANTEKNKQVSFDRCIAKTFFCFEAYQNALSHRF